MAVAVNLVGGPKTQKGEEKMNEFDINRAARMIRAGDEFSKTNNKLRDAVYSFIEWLFKTVDYQLPPAEKFGWSIKKEEGGRISLSFEKIPYGWHTITTNDNKPRMDSITLCCRALAGPEGEKLLAWLEDKIRERNQLLVALQSAMQAFRSSVAAT